MISEYTTIAETIDDGSLICKGCKDRYCVTVKEGGVSYFCPSYKGSAYDGKSGTFKVKCVKEAKC